jgi:isoleucyl-tRNA synthetase
LKIRVEKAAGQKCPRCWNYSTHIGESAAYPTVCERCAAALGEMGWVNGPETVKV